MLPAAAHRRRLLSCAGPALTTLACSVNKKLEYALEAG
jgi:hypothetical protein